MYNDFYLQYVCVLVYMLCCVLLIQWGRNKVDIIIDRSVEVAVLLYLNSRAEGSLSRALPYVAAMRVSAGSVVERLTLHSHMFFKNSSERYV